jgi:hypothetical protein
MHIVQYEVPEDPEELVECIKQIHELLATNIMLEYQAEGHTILPFHERDIVETECKYYRIISETSSTFYMRNRYDVDRTPNWGVQNENVMRSFFDEGSITQQQTIVSLKCGTRWASGALKNTLNEDVFASSDED